MLFDSLVLPILSYACEVWAVDKEVGESAEQLRRQFLKHVLGVRGSTDDQQSLLRKRMPCLFTDRFDWSP